MTGKTGPAAGRLFVCRTCKRDERVQPGAVSLGERLAQRIAPIAGSAGIEVRIVECLNACPVPCNVSLRAPGRTAWRFSGVDDSHADALVEFARRYVSGVDDDRLIGDCATSLSGRVTARSPTRPEAFIASGPHS